MKKIICIILVLISTVLFAEERESFVISNIEKWNHPTKKVFIDNGFKVEKVELINEKKFPIFYIKAENKEAEYIYNEEFIKEVAKANGYWDYKIIFKDDFVELFCDKKKKIVKKSVSSNSTLEFEKFTLTMEDAVKLLKSKLGKNILKKTSISNVYLNENGEYVVTQSSPADTAVLEWYHINAITKRITGEINGEIDFEELRKNEEEEPKYTTKQLKAKKLAEDFAEVHLKEQYYVKGITYVYIINEDENTIEFQVANPGAGMLNTIDRLTVDLKTKKVTSEFGN